MLNLRDTKNNKIVKGENKQALEEFLADISASVDIVKQRGNSGINKSQMNITDMSDIRPASKESMR